MINLLALEYAARPVHVGQVSIAAAALCLVVALISLKSALAPLGPLVKAVAAVTALAFAMSVALVLLTIAALHV